jgi:two-component sensor histidine kinase
VTLKPDDAEFLILEVADDGIGMPKAGGVGMEIAAALASQLGGSLRWESGSGTKISIWAPL